MSNKAYCLVCGREESEVQKMHYFPSAKKRSQMWQQNMWIVHTTENLRNFRICNMHFADECYLSKVDWKLCRNAIPTLQPCLPNSSKFGPIHQSEPQQLAATATPSLITTDEKDSLTSLQEMKQQPEEVETKEKEASYRNLKIKQEPEEHETEETEDETKKKEESHSNLKIKQEPQEHEMKEKEESQTYLKIKQEPEPEEHEMKEKEESHTSHIFADCDEIKIEECDLKSETLSETKQVTFECCAILKPNQAVLEKQMPVCISCRTPFERCGQVRLHNARDLHRCNKCILHQRIENTFKRRRPYGKQKCQSDDTCPKPYSVIVKRIVSICQMCQSEFQRSNDVAPRHHSDWLKCNKCILHSRLNVVFNRNRLKKWP